MEKPQSIKEIRKAVNMLSSLSEDDWEKIGDIADEPQGLNETINPKESTDVDKEKVVAELLRKIGVPAHIKGYTYLKTAVLFATEHPQEATCIYNVLYPMIAKEHGDTVSKVARAIQFAIEKAWDVGDMDLHNKIFGYSIDWERGKPTNSEAITGLAQYIKVYLI